MSEDQGAHTAVDPTSIKSFAARGAAGVITMLKKPLALLLCSVSLFSADSKKFSGAWFEINYPVGFTAQGSMPSAGVPDKFDSAFFTSPDKKVRFYIFSPQWAGETPDIAINADKEIETADKTEKSNGFTRRWYTIKPKGSGVTRSYVENTNADATVRWVVGVEYADAKAYAKHKASYLKFKKSLRQFAD